jgi:hypothetical protein
MDTQSKRKALPPVNASIKFRAAIRLMNTPYGQKIAIADRLAFETGRARRSVLQWQTLYNQRGSDGLLHSRADKGKHRIYSDQQIDLVIEAARKIRFNGDLAREWRKLGLPGCKETFRVWIRRVKKYGFIEEAMSA